MAEPFVIAKTAEGQEVLFRPALANRHGLITGATGTGKTVTLQVLADNFSRIGVPVFLADVKGDLSGLAAAGSMTPKLRDRLKSHRQRRAGVAREPGRSSGTCSAKRGFPVRATISDLGPLLLGRLLNLNPDPAGRPGASSSRSPTTTGCCCST